MPTPSSLDLDPRVDPLLGQTLGGKYTLERLIGRGGMGHVYSARVSDPDSEVDAREVVVKVIAPPLAQQPTALARFDREAKRLDGLRHSNIVEMYDFGREAGRAYIVMEWVDGELLGDYLARKGALALADFVPIAAQVLKGVGHAHSRDLMIRDIKPSNVMLCERKGRANFVKIIDFGLAKMVEDDEDITKQHFIGTSGYLSPEQIKGLDIDLRVDVYALGVLFYQMLSGRMPFEAENDTTLLYKHVHEFPTPLSEVLPPGEDVPEELVHLIHDCLEKEPNDRPRDANEIVEKLIDCVPMSMFKLPPVSTEAVEQTSISALSTSALDAPTGETANFLRAELRSPASQSFPQSARASASGSRSGVAFEGVTPTAEHSFGDRSVAVAQYQEPEAPSGSKIGLIVIGLGVAALIGVGAFVLFGGDKSAEADPSADVGAGKSSEFVSAVGEAESLLAEGEFEAADRKLAGVRGKVGDDLALTGRIEHLDKRIELARLLATAKALDDDGKTTAAVAAYRDVLTVDSSNAEARARIAELTDSDDAATGTVEISSEPAADLSIDGASVGTTPYDKPLALGNHTLEVSAVGYETWSKTIEIKAGDNRAIDVKLKPVAAIATGTGKKPSGATTKPTPVVAPTPTPTPEPAATKPEKDNPFLSTKKKTENGPFLPTEK